MSLQNDVMQPHLECLRTKKVALPPTQLNPTVVSYIPKLFMPTRCKIAKINGKERKKESGKRTSL